MPSLTDVYSSLLGADQELAKEASELEKVAAEEYAAGAITARGFMDECEKIAGASTQSGAAQRVNFGPGEGSTIHGGKPATPPGGMAQHPAMKALNSPAMQRMTAPASKPPAPPTQFAQK
jgi:hypothetical protein